MVGEVRFELTRLLIGPAPKAGRNPGYRLLSVNEIGNSFPSKINLKLNPCFL